MFIKLLILFTIVPLIELSLLIKLGQHIGLAATLVIVILTGIFGAYLARAQGFMIISKIQNDLRNGRIPADPLLDGILILSGGLLLVTPGLITDTIGLLILIPLTRKIIKKFLKRKIRQKLNSNQIYTSYTVE